jgi:molybdopterin molybdotransferase
VADLLNVDVALELVLKHIHSLEAEPIELSESLGRVLAADVIAQDNIPPFANSSVDGFAVRAGDVATASQDTPVMLKVIMDVPAGTRTTGSVGVREAARIMTGAPIPAGIDTVVPVENTDIKWTPHDAAYLPENVTIYRSAKSGDNIRLQGEDIQEGQPVLSKGTLIRPQEIGVLASIGCSHVPATRRPRVAVVSTGDELIPINEPITPGKIRDSNSYTLTALISACGGVPVRISAARDTLEDARRAFREALSHKPDVILSSAGVSVGAFDVVRAVIDELGEVNFWRINLRPGKPLAFGHLEGVPFFGLPGNPVSAMVTFEIFVRPTLLKLGNRPDHSQKIMAVLGENLRSDGRRSYLRVKLDRQGNQWIARTTGTQSSGALMSMVLADGLMIVPENVTELAAGESLPVLLLRHLHE